MRLEVLGCDWTGKAPPRQDALGGGQAVMWMGPEGNPSPVETRLAPNPAELPSLGPTLFSCLRPWGPQPLVLGQLLKGGGLCHF